ncbi:2-oxoisovalerate dehydrogenase [candidate division KSB1 bacterium]|nr:2-oxoisovalerate dehydrogenase [candidate division KSB1 bacterium]
MSESQTEIIFEVREAEEGGYNARALGVNIFTQGDSWEDLKVMVRDAVNLYYEDKSSKPKVIRLLHMTTREETIAVNPVAA